MVLSAQPYGTSWKTIDSLWHEAGLPRSAMERCDEVMARATAAHDGASAIRAMSTGMRAFISIHLRTEEEYAAMIDSLTQRAGRLPADVRPLASLMLGDAYAGYANSHFSNVSQRTETGAAPDDSPLQTWTRGQLDSVICLHYHAAFEGADRLPVSADDLIAWDVLTDEGGVGKTAGFIISDYIGLHVMGNCLRMNAGASTLTGRYALTDAKMLMYLQLPSGMNACERLAWQTWQEMARRAAPDKNKMACLDWRRAEICTQRNTGRRYDPEGGNRYVAFLDSLAQTADGLPISKYLYYNLTQRLGDDAAATRKKLAYCDLLTSRFPQDTLARLAALIREDVQHSTEGLEVFCVGNPVGDVWMLGPGEAAKLQVAFRNTDSLFINAYACAQPFGTNEVTLTPKETAQPFRSWRFSLPHTRDHVVHTTELAMEGLPAGYYVLLCSNAPFTMKDCPYRTIVTRTALVSSVMMAESSDDEGNALWYIADRKTGRPLEGVELSLFERWNTKRTAPTGKVVSDKDGIARIPGKYRAAEVSFRGEKFYRTFYGGSRWTEETRSIPEEHLFTDRAIYRPGQEVQFGGVATLLDPADGSKNGRRGEKITVKLHDANGRIQDSLICVTDTFFTFSGCFTLPRKALTGWWGISTDNGWAQISVENYKRPTFSVEVEVPDGDFRFGDDIPVQGLVQTYAGYPVDEATVAVRVRRNETPFLSRYGFYGMEETLLADTCRTDADGRFAFSFKAMRPSEGTGSISTFTIDVSVTDRAGETRNGKTSMQLGDKELYLDFSRPTWLKPDDPCDFTVRAMNARMKEEPVSIQMAVSAVIPPSRRLTHDAENILSDIEFPMPRQEHERLFPQLTYRSESDPDSMATGRVVCRWTGKTDSTGIVRLPELAALAPGWYKAACRAVSASGATEEATLTFRVVSETASQPIVTMRDWCIPVRTGGKQDFLFQIASGAEDGWVMYELQTGSGRTRKIVSAGTTPKPLVIRTSDVPDGATAHFVLIQEGHVHTADYSLEIPKDEENVLVRFDTFREKLQPGETTSWSLSVHQGARPLKSAVMLTVYDASLDAFMPHHWDSGLDFQYRFRTPDRPWRNELPFHIGGAYIRGLDFPRTSTFIPYFSMGLPTLSLLGAESGFLPVPSPLFMTKNASMRIAGAVEEESAMADAMPAAAYGDENGQEPASSDGSSALPLRSDFRETAFFSAHVRTDENGKATFSATMPESLTEWRMMGIAYSGDLNSGRFERSFVTQLPAVIQAQPPRLLHCGDTLYFAANVRNMSGKDIQGTAGISWYDALTGAPLRCAVTASGLDTCDRSIVSVAAGRSAAVTWKSVVPEGVAAVRYRISFITPEFSDGEESMLPILSRRTMVTETLPMVVPAGKDKAFSLTALTHSSESRPAGRLTLEVTPQPVWYALQALSSLSEGERENTERIFSRLYANSMASHLLRKAPRVSEVLRAWKQETAAGEDHSKLALNQDLKQVLLAETPWVLEAEEENDRAAGLEALTDVQRMAEEQMQTLEKLREAQDADGSFGWLPESGYPDINITSHIVTGLDVLLRDACLAPEAAGIAERIAAKGSGYLNRRFASELAKREKNGAKDWMPSWTEIQYVYALSLAGGKTSGRPAEQIVLHAVSHWKDYDVSAQAMLALVLHRTGDDKKARQIVQSLTEHADKPSPETGISWPAVRSGFLWHQNTMETMALLAEMYDEVTSDHAMVEAIQTWMLRQKQTRHWGNSRATVAACRTLMMHGTALAAPDRMPVLTMADEPVDITAQAEGTGYIRKTWQEPDIRPDMGSINISNPTKGLVWGALYWQHPADETEVTSASSGMTIRRECFIVRRTDQGETMEPISERQPLKVGDLVRVRLIVSTTADMDCVHLKAPRAAGMEPENVLSGYKHQARLTYYEAPGDAGTDFFISTMPKGLYMFEYDMRATHRGRFSMAPALLQCYYAPEFSARTEGGWMETE